MKKYIILLLTLFTFVSITYSQSKIDSSKYYLTVENKNFLKALDCCINRLNKWNKENNVKDGITTIKCSVANEEKTLIVSQIYTIWDIDHSNPDYYSYFNNHPIFWYFGKSFLSKPDSMFKSFVLLKFSKYVFNNMQGEKINDSDSTVLNGFNGVKQKVANKDLKPTIIGVLETSVSSPSFVIQMHGKDVTVEKLEIVCKVQ